MDEIQPSSLFSLSIDPVTKTHLSETARWARFLAIVGLIGVVLLVIGGVVYAIWMTSVMRSAEDKDGVTTGYTTGFTAASAIFLIVMAAVAFFPMLFMLRFANQMRAAINGNDQENLNNSFQNLKISFRYLGIITILGLGLWVLWLVLIGITILRTG